MVDAGDGDGNHLMQESRTTLIAALHAAARPTVVCVTGGGATAISELLSVPGASRTVLAAHVPYCEAALVEWLKTRPVQCCSERTARLMAMAAWSEARRLTPPERIEHAIGIACTAGLASDRPKRGAHRMHLAIQTAALTMSWSVELVKGARTRAQEERIAADAILDLLAAVVGIEERPPLMLLAGETPLVRTLAAPTPWQELLLGTRPFVAARAAELRHDAARFTIFPGSFNPLHEGHRALARIAAARTGRDLLYELSIANVDKPPLDYVELAERTAQFPADASYVLTAAPTFAEKALLFPGCVFAVGVDTILRIAPARYYGHDPARAQAAIDTLVRQGCRFLVFGRLLPGEPFRALADCDLADDLRAICDEVPEREFRADIRSTDLRERNL